MRRLEKGIPHWEMYESASCHEGGMSRRFKQKLGRATAVTVGGCKVTDQGRILAAQSTSKISLTEVNTGAESWE